MKDLLRLAPTGLAAAYRPDTGQFAQTVRLVRGPSGGRLQVEGTNLRYTAMAALGLSRLTDEQQRAVLHGRLACDIVASLAEEFHRCGDLGAVALAAWVQAEVNDTFADDLFSLIRTSLRDDTALPTVDAAWVVTAATVAARLGDTEDLVSSGARLLQDTEGAEGIYPHLVGPRDRHRWRAHVGSFADQVYPIQALARASLVTGEAEQLAAANRTAQRICALQGEQGQWWWHYDHRDGAVIEGYPVYSVHQHAMAPMVLYDLLAAGGTDHRDAMTRGLGWLSRRPETHEDLVSEEWGLIWRKVGRREPRKAARALGAVTTAVRPGSRLPGVDRVFPPRVVDHECRPYELGWLLYAWQCTGGDHE